MRGRARVPASHRGTAPAPESSAVASLTTRIPPRDWHLRTRHFFDATSYPWIVFEGTLIPLGGRRFRARGDLTIKGTTRPCELDGELQADAERLRLTASGRVDRAEFGVVAPAFVEMAGLMLGRDVDVTLDATFERAPSARPPSGEAA